MSGRISEQPPVPPQREQGPPQGQREPLRQGPEPQPEQQEPPGRLPQASLPRPSGLREAPQVQGKQSKGGEQERYAWISPGNYSASESDEASESAAESESESTAASESESAASEQANRSVKMK